MSGFTDNMIDDGFTDAQDYMDYLIDKASEDTWTQEPEGEYDYEYYDDEGDD